MIGYRDFEKINEEIEDVDAKYKNPRNLCSGSVRQLNNEITARRNVQFYAFSLVKADGVDFQNSRNIQLEWLKEQGFDVVEHYEVTKDTLEERVRFLRSILKRMIFRPMDLYSLTMILLTDNLLEVQRSSQEILLRLSGQTRSGRQLCGK